MILLRNVFTFNIFKDESLNKAFNIILEVILVLIILLILFKIIDIITKSIRKKMIKKNVDKPLSRTLYELMNKTPKVLLIISAISYLGLDTSSVVGMITAFLVGVGLALQGALSNFAGGIIIMILRPFKVDDLISALNNEGYVEDIHLFYTYLRTFDNRLVIIPNGQLLNSVVVNQTAHNTRRVDLVFSIDYDDDVKLAKEVILEECKRHPLVLGNQDITVRIKELSSSSVDIVSRCYTKTEDYYDVMFDINESVYDKLKEKGITIPFNQIVVSYRDKGYKNEEK